MGCSWDTTVRMGLIGHTKQVYGGMWGFTH